MTRQEFVERFEILVGKVQGVEMTTSELEETMESVFQLKNSVYPEDFYLDTIFKLWTLVDAEEDEDFNPVFNTMIATVNCINVGDKVKPVLLTYSELM